MRVINAIPSKSDAHRALICAALSKTPSQVIFRETSLDIEATKACLKALKLGESEMPCGESGSTLRFLLPIMGALGHKASFIPEGRLPERPLTPLYEELVKHGCKLSPKGSVPFTIEGQLEAGEYNLPGNVSSQYISGLLFALPLLQGNSLIEIEGNLESKSYVDMTIRTLKRFGIKIKVEDYGYFIEGGQEYIGPSEYQVEGDWSNASFWLVAGALKNVTDGICCKGLSMHSLQGDMKIINILKEFGAIVVGENDAVAVISDTLKGIEIDAAQIPDMVPILAVLASVSVGQTRIYNGARLRIKESDRLATVAKVISTLGGDIKETEDGLIINGKVKLKGGIVNGYGDHRIVMMAAIASTVCAEKVVITGSDAIKKSYPGFFQDLAKLKLDKNVERK